MKSCILFILFFSVFTYTGHAEETLIIGFSGVTKHERNFRIGENVVSEISKKMDVPIKLIALPPKRAIIFMEAGEIHAELARVDSYNKIIPSAIMVEEPIATLVFHAYTVSLDFKVNGFNSLKPYKIVTVDGHVYHKNRLQNFNTHEVSSAEAAFLFLQAGRADLCIMDTYTFASVCESPNLDKNNFRRLEPPVDQIDSYTFFSSDYARYVKPYNDALVAIKKEGIYMKIFTETK